MMSVIIQSIIVAILLITRNDFPAIFTESKLVMKEVSRVALFLSGTIFLSSIQPVLSGVAIGAGWQAVFAFINLGCYYIVGLASSVLLAFKFNMGLEGIWTGLIAGISLQTIILVVITWRTDWEKEVELARERLSIWGGSAVVSAIESQ
eukprot:TRINITY_DN28792_c0_g1_i2.p1 TRINITY_DN28792_c0_g1~~TRINITY_DN28792_c0_g1_i2.p1  ORF type:complete len:149 (+),score=11.13 TRINITY_DN28792_c0_g1_i2:483-929(+)